MCLCVNLKIMELDNFLRVTEARIKTEYGLNVIVVMMPKKGHVKMPPMAMCRVIGWALGLTEEEMVSKSRTQAIVVYRQLCCYFLRQYYASMSLKSIGKLIGGYDHSTIMFSIARVKQFLDDQDSIIMAAYTKATNAIAVREGELTEEYYKEN